jgi:GT2 family glycosyltransferase
VSFRSNKTQLVLTLTSLADALAHAQARGLLDRAHVVIVDNDSAPPNDPHLWPDIFFKLPWCETTTLSGHGNIGYGAANNLAFEKLAQAGDYEFFLVLNPDVRIDESCIASAIEHLQSESRTALISPVAVDDALGPLYLLRRYPSVFVLALRGFAPTWLQRFFSTRLAAYEIRGQQDPAHDQRYADAVIASGCFMFMRSHAFASCGLFDPKFFLYFEDYDLSLRMSRVGRIVRDPACRIIHSGGGAARKGLVHIGLFFRSAQRFFVKHGWHWF